MKGSITDASITHKPTKYSAQNQRKKLNCEAGNGEDERSMEIRKREEGRRLTEYRLRSLSHNSNGRKDRQAVEKKESHAMTVHITSSKPGSETMEERLKRMEDEGGNNSPDREDNAFCGRGRSRDEQYKRVKLVAF